METNPKPGDYRVMKFDDETFKIERYWASDGWHTINNEELPEPYFSSPEEACKMIIKLKKIERMKIDSNWTPVFCKDCLKFHKKRDSV